MCHYIQDILDIGIVMYRYQMVSLYVIAIFTLGGKFPIPLGLPNHPSHWRFKDLHFPLGGSTLWWCDDWENFTRSLVIDPFWSDIMEKSLCLLYLVNCVRSGGSKVGRKIVMTCHSCPSIKSDQKISMWHSCKYIPKASKSIQKCHSCWTMIGDDNGRVCQESTARMGVQNWRLWLDTMMGMMNHDGNRCDLYLGGIHPCKAINSNS